MNRARHILMTTDAVGGVWRYALDLSAELCREGCEVTLAVLGPVPSETQRREALRLEGLHLVETQLDLDWLVDGPGPVEWAAKQVAMLRRVSGADLVHCNSPALAGGAEFDCPLVVVNHGCIATWWEAVKGTVLPEQFTWHRELAHRGLLAADAVIAPSESHAEAVARVYALPRTPQAVHNARSLSARESSGKPPVRKAMTIGRLWDEAKSTAVLDAAAARIDIPFVAVGALRGPHGESCDLTHLEATGPVSAACVDELLAERPIVVSAARFEPFGLAVLEAASAGCALVLADNPTFRELWDGAALFADAASPEEFAQAINRLDRDPALRAQLAAAAASRAARLTPEQQSARMQTIYEGVLARCEAMA